MKLRNVLAPATASCLVILISACGGGGGGGGGGGNANVPPGSLTFSVTDSPSDEITSFQVDVASLRVTRSNGTVFSILSAPVTVDLAALSEVGAMLDITTLPPGKYTQARMTLDFTSASAVLAGQTSPATILDGQGAPLTGQLDFPMNLSSAPLQVIGGRNRFVEFDFDLDQSLAVDLTANEVRVEPALALRIDPPDAGQVVGSGRLERVDMTAQTFVLRLEGQGGAQLTSITFEVSDSTAFHIDGHAYPLARGLASLAAHPAGTWIQAYGTPDPFLARVSATTVEAGMGTYNGGQDIVEGYVLERSGGSGADAKLTVLGSSSDAAHTSSLYNTSFTVLASYFGTSVMQLAASNRFSLDAVDVGQRVQLYGSLTGTAFDVSLPGGSIRMLPTELLGHADGAPSDGVLGLDLDRVGQLDQSLFVWNNGETTPVDPDAMKLDVGTLGPGLAIVAGTPVAARGFFTAVDDEVAPFVAAELVNLEDAPSLALVRDQIGGMVVTTDAREASITFTILGTPGPGEVALIDHGFAGSMPFPSTPPTKVEPSAPVTRCSLHDKVNGTILNYTEFDQFSAALGHALEAGGRLAQFGAVGDYDAATNELSATEIDAVVD